MGSYIEGFDRDFNATSPESRATARQDPSQHLIARIEKLEKDVSELKSRLPDQVQEHDLSDTTVSAASTSYSQETSFDDSVEFSDGAMSINSDLSHWPDPQVFDGDRKLFKHWLAAVEDKLDIDSHLFEHDSQRAIHYVASHCSKRVIDLINMDVEPFSPLTSDLYRSVDDFLDRLKQVFGKRNPQKKALLEWNALKQGDDEPFDAFLNKFQDLADRLGRHDDDKLIEDLEERLNRRMFDNTLYRQSGVELSFEAFVEYLRAVEEYNREADARERAARDGRWDSDSD